MILHLKNGIKQPKTEFNSSEIANHFKGKKVDIFGIYYGANCIEKYLKEPVVYMAE